MNVAQFTETNLVALPLLSDWRNNAVRELSFRLHDAGRVDDAASFAGAVLKNETLDAIVFDRFAFLPARSRVVRSLSFALGIAPRGVTWKLDGSPVVYVVVLLAAPLSEKPRYSSLVNALAELLKNRKLLTALCRCTKPEEAYALLSLFPAG
jgi:mannitol/fructose-specific phosphotransferase system IIA component (Ntr-type)